MNIRGLLYRIFIYSPFNCFNVPPDLVGWWSHFLQLLEDNLYMSYLLRRLLMVIVLVPPKLGVLIVRTEVFLYFWDMGT